MSKRVLLVAVLIICIICTFCTLNIFHSKHGFQEKSATQSPVQGMPLHRQEQVSTGLPVRLQIPKIGVDAAVEYVALTPDGAMRSPANLADVAWFKLGPRPGQKGSAVIAGHRSRKNWAPAVFDHLQDLSAGDYLYIEDEKGATITFVVRGSRTYDPEENASDVFHQSDGIHLNLVTCDGDWDETQKSFTRRLVIFADAVP